MANLNASLDNRHKLALPYWARPGISSFAAKDDGGGKGGKADDEDEDDADDEDDDDADDEDDDPDEGKSPDELKAELGRTRAALKKANDEAARRRRKAIAARKAAEDDTPKGKSKAKAKDDDEDDVETRVQAATKAERERANTRIVNSEAKAELLSRGADKAKVKRLLGLLDRDELEVDDDGEVDGLEDAVDTLVDEFPELFKRPKSKRIQGKSGKDDDGGDRKTKSATDLQVEQLRRGSRR